MALPKNGESSKDPWHTVSLRIPFYSSEHAIIAKRSLQVDREQNASFVTRELNVEDDVLVVMPQSEYTATTLRLLRLATNSFLSSVDLVMRTMESFAPDPSDPDHESDPQVEVGVGGLRLDDGGGMKGIELKI